MTLGKRNFTEKIAHLHEEGVSSSGKFGFPVPTYQGNLPQDTTECHTWEEIFTRGVQRMFELEEASQGHDEEMTHLSNAIIEKVIPRRLRPLETEGKSVTPCLVHGDLWDGNTGADAVTIQPLIFDTCCLYAHHECKYDVGA
jgi:protein-ribulosamine 3-kinase